MYIGKEPIVGNFQKCDAITVVNGQAAYTLQVSSTNVVPESANHMLVSLNGILQAPITSFTVSGSTLTFASNLATGDVIDFVILLGNVLDLGTPSDGTVTAAKVANDLISGKTALASEPADTDEFLVSDAGTLKRIDYSLIKGGGQWEHLLTSTASNSASIAFSSTYITTTYLDYMIVFSGIKFASDNIMPRLMFSTDNGSSYASDYRNARMGVNDGGNDVNSGQTGSGGLYMGSSQNVGNSTGEGYNGYAIIWDPMKQSGTTDAYTKMQSFVSYNDTGIGMVTSTTANMNKVTTAVNNIKFEADSGNITTGKVSLYGRKIS